MTDKEQLDREVDKHLKSAQKLLDKAQPGSTPFSVSTVKETAFHEFRLSAASWLLRVFGERHLLYKSFNSEVTHATTARTKRGIAILKTAKKEIGEGWQEDLSSIIIKDMLQEMLRGARYQQKAGNSRCAVVQCGAVLEFALQRLCLDGGLSIVNEKMQGKAEKKRALQLAGEAYKKKLYERRHYKSLLDSIELYNKLSSDSSSLGSGMVREAGEMLDTVERFLREVDFRK